MSDPARDPDKRAMPAWLLGLVIAAVLFVIGIFVFSALGFGDNPVLEQVSIPAAFFLGRQMIRRDNSGI